MRQGTRWTGVLTLALAMVVVGTLLPGRAERTDSPLAGTGAAVDSLLAPTAGSDVPAVVARLQERVREDRNDVRSLALLGLAYLKRAGQTQDPVYLTKAGQVIDRALALQPDGNYEAFVGAGNLALARHDFRRALMWGRRGAGLRPDAPEPLGITGDALIELGHYSAAAGAIQSMVDRRPALPSYARVSYFREMHGDLDGAVAAMRAAYSAAGTAVDAAWVDVHLGELYIKQNRIDLATRHLRRAHATVPKDPAASFGLAHVAMIEGRRREAIRIMRNVVLRYPSPVYAAFLGELFVAAGDRRSAGYQFDLVRAQIELAEANGGIADVETYLFLLDHGSVTDDLVAELVALYTSRPSVRVADVYAWALFKSGRLHRAGRVIRAAVKLGTPDPLIEFHAARIYSALGHYDRARAEMRKAVSHGLAAWPLQMKEARSRI
ncbi:MAG TPA: hypothetical protein VNP73_03795 [Actinomycetota bacterium]|nr:hypothetical protein [Actinomycetota bacterium]